MALFKLQGSAPKLYHSRVHAASSWYNVVASHLTQAYDKAIVESQSIQEGLDYNDQGCSKAEAYQRKQEPRDKSVNQV